MIDSRIKEALVILRCLRMHFYYRVPVSETRRHELLAGMFARDSLNAADIIELALSENEKQAREEIRRELGEEPDGVATISSETLRRCAGEADAGPSGTAYGDLEL